MELIDRYEKFYQNQKFKPIFQNLRNHNKIGKNIVFSIINSCIIFRQNYLSKEVY
jgi:hypothetical protein